jgi:acetylornithine/N-succinyldiaminopimelate aminotransferase
MTKFDEIQALDAEHVMQTYGRLPVAFVRGEGTRLWDSEGKEYLDFLGGLAVVSLGHAHPAVADAVAQQARTLLHVSNLYYNDVQPRVAERLDNLLGGGGRVFFCNSGAEANEAAIKYARKATGRAGVVALEGGFHGRTLGALSATGQPGKRAPFEPLFAGVRFVPPNDVDALRGAVDDDVGLILLEPVLGEGGVVPLERAFAEAAAELPPLLCVDEVQTGIGRTGTFFGFEQLGVQPDLVTLAKALANGLPIGALLVADDAAGAFAPGDHGSTFGGNPVSCAAAAAVVEAIDDELLADLRARGAQLASGLAQFDGVLEVRGRGLLLGAVVEGSAADVVEAARSEGLLALTAGENVLRLAPPLTVSVDEVDEALAVLGRILC